jgi:hypothetical protein
MMMRARGGRAAIATAMRAMLRMSLDDLMRGELLILPTHAFWPSGWRWRSGPGAWRARRAEGMAGRSWGGSLRARMTGPAVPLA